MPSDDDSSDLSSLSSLSPAPSHDELEDLSDAPAQKKGGILKFFPKLSEQPRERTPPPPRKRSPSPPHEYVLADNPDIAVRAISLLCSVFFFCVDVATLLASDATDRVIKPVLIKADLPSSLSCSGVDTTTRFRSR